MCLLNILNIQNFIETLHLDEETFLIYFLIMLYIIYFQQTLQDLQLIGCPEIHFRTKYFRQCKHNFITPIALSKFK